MTELVECCIDLALIFKCDPFIFLDRPAREIFDLYKLTNARLNAAPQE